VSCGPVEGYPDLTTLAAAHPASPPAVDVTENDDTTILYTSGTTGRPKGHAQDYQLSRGPLTPMQCSFAT
jgi:acyl-coenzyme A synthetase/AMP-(fatty) acid ligase